MFAFVSLSEVSFIVFVLSKDYHRRLRLKELYADIRAHRVNNPPKTHSAIVKPSEWALLSLLLEITITGETSRSKKDPVGRPSLSVK